MQHVWRFASSDCAYPYEDNTLQVFRDVTQCSPLTFINVLEEHTASIFRVEEYAKQATSLALWLALASYWLLHLCDYRRSLDWWLYLTTTYTHDSELQAITDPPRISTIHKSKHLLSIFPACCVFTSHSLATASNSGDSSASRAHGPSRKPLFQQYLYCCVSIRCCVNLFTEPLPRNGSGIFAYLAVVTQ
jgi:hypothetical protein